MLFGIRNAVIRIESLELPSSKSDWETAAMILFTEDDKVSDISKRYYSEDEDDYEPDIYFVYSTSLQKIKDRLDVLGFTYKKAVASYNLAISEELKLLNGELSYSPPWDRKEGKIEEIESDIRILEGLTFEKWLEGIKYLINKYLGNRSDYQFRRSRGEKYGDLPEVERFILKQLMKGNFGDRMGDFRTYLRAVIEVPLPDAQLIYDLSGLIENNLAPFEANLNQEARRRINEEFLINHKIVVLTEGSTDRRVIQSSLKLFYPHLMEYFSFMDFEGIKAQGSAGHLANTVKSFIGAGIANRIIAFFDNDSAAKDAARSLKPPPNVKVFHYPDIDIARNYPTLGPQGNVSMNVNGLACSLEMYFGKDILTKPDGDFYPIQWTGFIEGVKKHQGEVTYKKDLQTKYIEQLEKCQADPSLIEKYDWSGMKAIINCLLTAFHDD